MRNVLHLHSAVNNQFDAEPKRWRMLSAIALDLSMFLELLTPLVPHYFLPIASVANIGKYLLLCFNTRTSRCNDSCCLLGIQSITGKNISFLAASASRATIHKSFAAHENLADVTAKAGSQTIAASMVGTGLGILVSSQIGADWSSVAMGCMAFSTVHLACTYRSLMHVVQNTVSIRVRCARRNYAHLLPDAVCCGVIVRSVLMRLFLTLFEIGPYHHQSQSQPQRPWFPSLSTTSIRICLSAIQFTKFSPLWMS